MKKIKLLIVCLLMAAWVFAQNSNTEDVKRIHEIGIHAGATTGVGISYRYWPKKLGIQITMLPIKTNDETMINLGITGLYSIHQTRHIRFFGYFGNNLVYDKYNKLDYYYDSYSGYSSSNNRFVESTKYNIGIGPGFSFGTRIRVSIMAGYGLYDIFNEFNIFPTGEIGLYYCF